MKYFPSTLRRINLKTQQSPAVHFGFVIEENMQKNQMIIVAKSSFHTKAQSRRFQISRATLVWRLGLITEINCSVFKFILPSVDESQNEVSLTFFWFLIASVIHFTDDAEPASGVTKLSIHRENTCFIEYIVVNYFVLPYPLGYY